MKGINIHARNAAASKVEAIKQFETETEFYGDNPNTTEMHARQTADDNDWIYVSP